jgi:hypothetical protein
VRAIFEVDEGGDRERVRKEFRHERHTSKSYT